MQFRSVSAAAAVVSLFASGWADAASTSLTYTYDYLGRVATALYDNDTCIVYGYDANGNRTAQTNTTTASPETPTWGTGAWGCTLWTSGSGHFSRRGKHLVLAAPPMRQAPPGPRSREAHTP